jgi:hypothetical protein
MDQQCKGKCRLLLWPILAMVIVLAVVCFRIMVGRPGFDADKVAQAETRMWQAYYSEDKTQLGFQLIALLRNQHGLSLLEAKEIGELLARSAMKFRLAKGDYESVALPDLAKAYSLIKLATGAPFDPDKVARAELAWWVARRTPGQNSTEQVGKRIAELYALLYDRDHPAFEKAGLLRAQAAKMRDSGGKNADWVRVEALLRKSYRELKTGYKERRSRSRGVGTPARQTN